MEDDDFSNSRQKGLSIQFRDSNVQSVTRGPVKPHLKTTKQIVQSTKQDKIAKTEKPLMINKEKQKVKVDILNSEKIKQERKITKHPPPKDEGTKLRKSYKKEFKYPLEINFPELIKQLQAGNTSHIEPINEHNFHFVFNPTDMCNFQGNITDHKILILVKSAALNSERRSVIRDTWAKQLYKNMRLVFVLGLPERGNLRVRVEFSKYGDIVQENFIDNYRNNTIKMEMAYKWAVTECQSAEYLFFVDDDYFVNVDNLQNYFRSDKVRDKRNFFAGTLLGNSVPYRAKGSKWYISWEQYPFDRWPPYIAGGGYFVSMDVAQRFHLAFPYVKPMHIDDVFLGITARKLGIRPKQNRDIGYRKQGKISLKRLIACHGYDKRADVEGAMLYLQQEKQKHIRRSQGRPP